MSFVMKHPMWVSGPLFPSFSWVKKLQFLNFFLSISTPNTLQLCRIKIDNDIKALKFYRYIRFCLFEYFWFINIVHLPLIYLFFFHFYPICKFT